jgi:hypothetical protein
VRGPARVGAIGAAVHHDARVEARDAPPGIQLEAAQAEIGGPQRMRARELVLLADVDQRDLAAGQQLGSNLLCGGLGKLGVGHEAILARGTAGVQGGE